MKFIYTALITATERTPDTVTAALKARFDVRQLDALAENRYKLVAVITPQPGVEVTHDDVFKASAALISDALAPHFVIDSATVDDEDDSNGGG